ncbi:MAG: regulatory protein RecX [Gammaproteobacteria bacterium]|nr:regulatory protein RecX [Gammaproteobacteria bacterium]
MSAELSKDYLESETAIYNRIRQRAFSLLARREYSEFELRSKLYPLASESLVDRLIDELIKNNMQSDSRYAEMLCRSRFNQGKGPVKILYELGQNQISSSIVDAVMGPYEGEWALLAKQVREKKFGKSPVGSYREWVRQARFLQQRGFNASHFGDFTE